MPTLQRHMVAFHAPGSDRDITIRLNTCKAMASHT